MLKSDGVFMPISTMLCTPNMILCIENELSEISTIFYHGRGQCWSFCGGIFHRKLFFKID